MKKIILIIVSILLTLNLTFAENKPFVLYNLSLNIEYLIDTSSSENLKENQLKIIKENIKEKLKENNYLRESKILGEGVILLKKDNKNYLRIKAKLNGNSILDLRSKVQKINKLITKPIKLVFKEKKGDKWIVATDKKGRWLDDRYLVSASVKYNELYQPMIEIKFNEQGKEVFKDITTRLIDKEFSIFLGNKILLSTKINEPILGGKAVIMGNYTKLEANQLANKINTLGLIPIPRFINKIEIIKSKKLYENIGDSFPKNLKKYPKLDKKIDILLKSNTLINSRKLLIQVNQLLKNPKYKKYKNILYYIGNKIEDKRNNYILKEFKESYKRKGFNL